MARHRIPQVIDDTLILLDDAGASLPSILVGSAGWYAWLNEAATRSFAYHSASGTLTARRNGSMAIGTGTPIVASMGTSTRPTWAKQRN